MTNKSRIQNLSDEGLERFLKNFCRVCPYPEYADISKWLESENEEMIWKGEETTFQGRAAFVVDEKVIFGRICDVLIQDDGVMVKVPRKVSV